MERVAEKRNYPPVPITGQFRREGKSLIVADSSTLAEYMAPCWVTGAVAGVCWQVVEAYTCAPVDAMGAGGAVGAAVHVDVTTAVPSIFALLASMQAYRVFSYFVP